ncbi:hypothetical protein J1C56_12510 [Aminobacter anthyllidis]|uniref:Uncharacterized protein n=1 Tax=Aminobacter anthyllidis TaxID=1035067 RepID=A0A9X1AAP5_9HYPH|nr:hypothetical protein [Aminobacter anthyllidis]MBT1156414.1 hypothetical protein [Aminobacter anthyllidis]
MPRPVAALALPVAAAGYHVYLFHRLVPELLLPQLKLPWPAMATLSVATGILTGIAAAHGQKALTAWLAGRRGHGAALGAHAAPAE